MNVEVALVYMLITSFQNKLKSHFEYGSRTPAALPVCRKYNMQNPFHAPAGLPNKR